MKNDTLSHNHSVYRTTHQSQSGAVLILTLIILAVFSVLSVSAARSSIWNEQMAANFSRNEISFQLAESAGPYALNQISWVNSALSRMDTANNVVGAYNVPASKAQQSISITLQAKNVLMPGYSLLVDGGSRFIQLQTDSSAQIDNGAATKLVQGFVRAGAG